MSSRTALSMALALCLVGGLLWQRTAGFSAFTYETWRQSQVVRQRPPVSDWRLQDDQGKVVRLSDWGEQVLLVSFIFTRCTSVCGALGVRYRQLQRAMEATGSKRVRLLSVSIDPAHDTPERLAEYRSRFGGARTSWTIARPADEQTLSTLISETGLRVIPDRTGGFAHSDSLHWIRDGRLVRISAWTDPALEGLLTDAG
ncbi:SCO family protein [Thiorhodococcus minor]|uniref:SCO family protein n=1 Tax=Thiorhodococcus minor TaxID=57489 RepID=A0A6M0K447_9GAMM|nr:SCO family protein [Thiorhodococcus minor]NEV64562.1 SCO family protein [Thiorhodococcus minor]